MTQHVFYLYHSRSSVKDGQNRNTTRERNVRQEAAVISQMDDEEEEPPYELGQRNQRRKGSARWTR